MNTLIRLIGLAVVVVVLSGCGPADTVSGEGVIQHVQPEHDRVNLRHEAIPEMDWPEMTMGFRVTDAVDLEAFSEGDEVRFDVRRDPDEDGIHVITAMDHAE